VRAGKAIALLAYENFPNSRLRAGVVLVDMTQQQHVVGPDMGKRQVFSFGSAIRRMVDVKKSRKPTRTI
jgi:hypothetical protein